MLSSFILEPQYIILDIAVIALVADIGAWLFAPDGHAKFIALLWHHFAMDTLVHFLARPHHWMHLTLGVVGDALPAVLGAYLPRLG